MKKLIFQFLLLGFFILASNSVMAQRRCGTQLLHNQKMHNDPAYRAQFESAEKKIAQTIKQVQGKARANCTTPQFFPVAVHFDWIPSAADQAKLITLAQNQIATLNTAYNGSDCQGTTNSNCFEFKLATNNHPTGSGIMEGQPAVTFGGTAGVDYCATSGGRTNPCNLSRWVGYMNITVNNLSGGNECSDLGVSHLIGNPTTMNSMSVNSCAFGSNNIVTGVAEVQDAANANKCDCLENSVNGGTTVVHEIGHFLGLYHTFCADNPSKGPNGTTPHGSIQGADIGSCEQNAVCGTGCLTTACDCDLVGDTPAQAFSNNGCPGNSASGTINNPSTGDATAFNNYMDYVDDACMTCFSQGQYTRIASTLSNATAGASNYKSKSLVCAVTTGTPPVVTTTPTPSISDPCSCTDPLNRKGSNGAITHFHDVLTVSGTASQAVVLTTGGANFLDNTLTQIADGTNLGTIPASGVFTYDFYHASGSSGNITLTVGGTALPAFAVSVCNTSACTTDPIPTMSEWGLMIFGLLILNLAVFSLRRREEIMR